MKCIVLLVPSIATAVAVDAVEADLRSGTNVTAITPALIRQLAEELRTNHPALQAAAARTTAASANVASVRTWEDPVVRLGGMAARPDMRASQGNLLYGVEQKLPLFGKPQRARAVAQTELASEQARSDYEFQLRRADLAKTLFKTALLDRSIEIGRQDQAWLQTLVMATDAKYRAGEATLAELLEVQNELAKRTNQLRTDVTLRTSQHVVLNRLLNRPLEATWPVLGLPPVGPAIAYSPRLVEWAQQYEPRTRVLRQQVKQAEAAVQLARRQRLPDVSTGLEARHYTGNGSFREGMFVVGLSLPWPNADKYRNAIRREEARQRAAELDLADWQGAVRQEVYQLTVALDAARREAVLYRDEIIPRSQQALASAQAAWETGRRTLREVLEARRMVLEAQLTYARAVAEQYTLMADLVLCCGLGDFEALEKIGALTDTTKEDQP